MQSALQRRLLPYLPHGGRSWASWARVPAEGYTGLNATTDRAYNYFSWSKVPESNRRKMSSPVCCVCTSLRGRKKRGEEEKKGVINELLKPLHIYNCTWLHTNSHFFWAPWFVIIMFWGFCPSAASFGILFPLYIQCSHMGWTNAYSKLEFETFHIHFFNWQTLNSTDFT